MDHTIADIRRRRMARINSDIELRDAERSRFTARELRCYRLMLEADVSRLTRRILEGEWCTEEWERAKDALQDFEHRHSPDLDIEAKAWEA